jgi:hypothetical protein
MPSEANGVSHLRLLMYGARSSFLDGPFAAYVCAPTFSVHDIPSKDIRKLCLILYSISVHLHLNSGCNKNLVPSAVQIVASAFSN